MSPTPSSPPGGGFWGVAPGLWGVAGDYEARISALEAGSHIGLATATDPNLYPVGGQRFDLLPDPTNSDPSYRPLALSGGSVGFTMQIGTLGPMFGAMGNTACLRPQQPGIYEFNADYRFLPDRSGGEKLLILVAIGPISGAIQTYYLPDIQTSALTPIVSVPADWTLTARVSLTAPTVDYMGLLVFDHFTTWLQVVPLNGPSPGLAFQDVSMTLNLVQPTNDHLNPF